MKKNTNAIDAKNKCRKNGGKKKKSGTRKKEKENKTRGTTKRIMTIKGT